LRIFLVSGIFVNSNWTAIFGALIFYHERHLEIKKSTRGGPWAKRD
jgi:hypothetical protein